MSSQQLDNSKYVLLTYTPLGQQYFDPMGILKLIRKTRGYCLIGKRHLHDTNTTIYHCFATFKEPIDTSDNEELQVDSVYPTVEDVQHQPRKSEDYIRATADTIIVDGLKTLHSSSDEDSDNQKQVSHSHRTKASKRIPVDTPIKTVSRQRVLDEYFTTSVEPDR
jgi:hypothetical protein